MRRAIETISAACALLGGAILIALALLTGVSVVGRQFFEQPILGDVELVQMGCAMAVALFLPYAQIKCAHISVDFFTARWAERSKRRFDAIGLLAMTTLCALLAWRSVLGMRDLRDAGEITTILGFPVWIAYAAIALGLALSVVAGFVATWCRLHGRE